MQSKMRNWLDPNAPLTRWDRIRLWAIRNLLKADERVGLSLTADLAHKMLKDKERVSNSRLMARHWQILSCYIMTGKDMVADEQKILDSMADIWKDK